MNNSEYFWYFVALAVSSPINVLGLFLLFTCVVILMQAQFNPKSKIDLTYTLFDAQAGNVTLAKLGGFVALLTSTWIIAQQAVTAKMDSTMFAAYIAGWGTVKVAQDYFNSKADVPAVSQETKTTTTVTVPQDAVPVAAVEAPVKAKKRGGR